MIDEILSAIDGNAIVRLVSRIAPPRKKEEFDRIPPEELDRRNRRPFAVTLLLSFSMLFVPIVLFSPIQGRSGWFALSFLGALIGGPFLAVLFAVAVIRIIWGAGRLREFGYYLAKKEQLDTRVYVVGGGLLSGIAILSYVGLFFFA